jgi:hypothetical protein
MKRLNVLGAVCLLAATAVPATAAEWTVTITNAANGTYFTPLMVAAHSKHVDAFQVGEPASDSLQLTAECGNTSGLIAAFENAGADIDNNPAGGALAPGASATATLHPSRWNDRLTIAGMLVPTNDGFVGLDSIRVPKVPGTYTYAVNGYDAGTEANDEWCANIPGPTCGGIGLSPGPNYGDEGYVHVHRGIHGIGDLAEASYDWRNPVAKISIVRTRSH